MSQQPTIESIDIEHLLFDPINPRLPLKIRGYNKENAVLEWMLENENVIGLMGSIGEKGYFPAEPLLVIPSSKFENKFEVIEGNRRFAAVKLLAKPSLATTRKNAVNDIVTEAKITPFNLPVIKFKKREEILVYLGYRHITGVKEWGPLAKAKYLDELRKTLKTKTKEDEYKILAKIIGSNASYVRSILTGLEIYKTIEQHNFFDIKGLDEVNVEFGVLYTAVNRKGISVFVGIDFDINNPTKNTNIRNLKKITSWIFEENSEGFTRLGESRNLPDLEKVIANKEALKKFEEGMPLDEAVLYTDKPIEVFNDSLDHALTLIKIARDQIHHIDDFTEVRTDSLSELKKLIDFLLKNINSTTIDKEV